MIRHLYLMRHGQTLFNKRRKIQGWSDSPLTELGIRQALSQREVLKDIPFDHCYSSTSERCCDTLEIVTDSKVEYKRLKGLRERNNGLLEGESEDLNPKTLEGYDEIALKYDGETLDQATNRITQTLNEIINQDDHTYVLAVSSSGVMLLFWAHLCGKHVIEDAIRNGEIPNGSIMHYTYEDGKWNLEEIIKPNI